MENICILDSAVCGNWYAVGLFIEGRGRNVQRNGGPAAAVTACMAVSGGVEHSVCANGHQRRPNFPCTGFAAKEAGTEFFIIQLVLNFFWSLIFFNLQAYGLAFFWLVALWIVVFLMILVFNKVDPAAAWLQIPYLVWLTFAGYLSFAVWQLN